MELHNKTIIVTGASSGIGAAAARLFAEEGANVVLGARREAELQALVEEVGQPIRRSARGTDPALVRERALDYSQTRSLAVTREIEADGELKMIERIVEATSPEIIRNWRSGLAQRIRSARSSGDPQKLEWLKEERDAMPSLSLNNILNAIAVEDLPLRRDAVAIHKKVIKARVREKEREWRRASSGERPPLDSVAAATDPLAVHILRRSSTPLPALKPPKHKREHPMWAAYDDIVDVVFKTGFQKFMWDVYKGYGQFILDNADPNVPGRTPMELADKLIGAVKQGPIAAGEFIASYEPAPATSTMPSKIQPAGSRRAKAVVSNAVQEPLPGERQTVLGGDGDIVDGVSQRPSLAQMNGLSPQLTEASQGDDAGLGGPDSAANVTGENFNASTLGQQGAQESKTQTSHAEGQDKVEHDPEVSDIKAGERKKRKKKTDRAKAAAPER